MYHALSWGTQAKFKQIRPLRGNFLKGDLAAFDSAFFNMSEQEVSAMDPQQRGLLETSYRALENGEDLRTRSWCFLTSP